MPAIGIQNMDRWTSRLEKIRDSCSLQKRDKAMEIAGEILRSALEMATPLSETGTHYTGERGGKTSPSASHGPGNARISVINVSAKSKEYGITRRLIGYSRRAFYMFFYERGSKHQRQRAFMRSIFNSSIGDAMTAAREYIKKEAGF